MPAMNSRKGRGACVFPFPFAPPDYIDPGPCNKKPFSGNPIRIGTHAQTSY